MPEAQAVPSLITPGVIARRLNEPLHRILNVLRTRSHIRPVARAGRIRLYSVEAVAQVRYELNRVDARRAAHLDQAGGGSVDQAARRGGSS